MRECALCKERARAFCESDQASLCWSCDSKVHCANFLVARHSRTLLCHSCQSLTPWKASGPNLCCLTVSFCYSCVGRHSRPCPNEGGGDHDEEERNDGHGDGGDETEDEDGHVMPWSSLSSSSAAGPPPPTSCSSSEEENDDVTMPSPTLKRTAEDSADLPSQPRESNRSHRQKHR